MAETPRATQAADRMQSSVATLKNGLRSLPARQEQDDDGERLRGVVALPRQREIPLKCGKLEIFSPNSQSHADFLRGSWSSPQTLSRRSFPWLALPSPRNTPLPLRKPSTRLVA